MFTVVAREDSQKSTAVVGSLLDELVRDGARQMLAAALQAEVAAIESTFATARLRTKVTKGPGSRMAGLAMAFKLIEAGSGPVEGRQRTSPRRARPGWCHVPQGQTRRTTHQQPRRIGGSHGRLKDHG